MEVPSFVAGLYTNKVTVGELKMGQLKPVILVDVRSPEDYAIDRIRHSISVPLDDIQDGDGIEKVQAIVGASLNQNQHTPTVVLYCEICPGAIRAYQQLKQTGLNLAVLQGGLTAWRQTVPAGQDAEILTKITAAMTMPACR
jgi:rhodanese-related sulfurtransferase